MGFSRLVTRVDEADLLVVPVQPKCKRNIPRQRRTGGTPMRSYRTPRDVAAYFGIKIDKVLAWIHTGELRAINAAQKSTGRPRYRILDQDLRDFETRRANHTVPQRKRRRTNAALALARRPEVKRRY